MQNIDSKGVRGVFGSFQLLAFGSCGAHTRFGCMGSEGCYGMIVRHGRVIFCKTGAHFAAEGIVVSSISSGSVSVLAALPGVIRNG